MAVSGFWVCCRRLKPYYVSCPELAKSLGIILTENNLTLAVAESCTGGLLGAAITDIAGSSRYFAGGVIAYGDRIKSRGFWAYRSPPSKNSAR